MKEYSIFDIVGPNMIGPSSSHTAGACRIGQIAHKLAKGDIKEVVFMLHGSFAKTYKGHGTDKALLGGILGFDTDDERIKYSFQIAQEHGLKYDFIEANFGDAHPNTVKIIILKNNNEKLELIGVSIGGGNIKITEIDGVQLEFTGMYPTLIISHIDKPGVIYKATEVLYNYNVNIAFMRVYRDLKGKDATMIIESDNPITEDIIADIKSVNNVTGVYLVGV
jgi:L-serine dehydratase